MNTDTSTHPDTITKEIRFAVVMYGGISLAIYMNGIAQELLALVKSTTESTRKTEPGGTEKIYREIADYLSVITPAFRHKYIVDIISGTSAGGINGICLAKGLVRGLDDLKVLKDIWLNEGNIDTLLNDSESQPHLYRSKEPKTSLFNSQRMYAKLLEAFKKMECSAKADTVPHVSSMDLFVTATDLRGLQVPIQLGNGSIYEHIHRHVFPFKYREDTSLRATSLNHFLGDYDPMLAFASRCTSSIPPAFEPVKISDILNYLDEREHRDYETIKKHVEEWKASFFRQYFLVEGNEPDGISLKEREFADGGYLDNRPFGHAINAIHTRQADCPVDRKLLFIDPSPEDKEEKESTKEISFAKNTSLTFTLPRYETIREELRALQGRNEWIQKVRHILEEKLINNNREHLKNRIKTIELPAFLTSSTLNSGELHFEQLFSMPEPGTSSPSHNAASGEINAKEFWRYIANPDNSNSIDEAEKKDFNSMCEALGGAYPAYHYTRINLLTDQLALMIARAGMVDDNAAIVQTIRDNLKEWRTTYYNTFRQDGSINGEMKTENIFFREYDLDFRIRRLSYFRKILEKAISEQKIEPLFFGMLHDQPDAETSSPCQQWDSAFSQAIRAFYKELVNTIKSYYLLREKLLSSGKENHLFKELCLEVIHLENQAAPEPLTSVSHEHITGFLTRQYNSESESADFKTAFDNLMLELHNFIGDEEQSHQHGTLLASEQLFKAFSRLSENYPEIAGRLRFMYDYGYDLYDATTFQLLAGGDYGEGNVVDILRISTADATSLWNETTKKRSKLAGIALGAFGGFLDREWRRNDIMWGRLDAAERIITALLPDSLPAECKDKRAEFITRVQEIILRESLKEWIDELQNTRFTSSRDEEQYQRLLCIQNSMNSSGLPVPAKGEPLWKQKFMSVYDFHRDMDPEPNLRRLGRGSGIISSMIDRLDPGEGITKKISGYLKKLNWILLGMLDFSTPKTMKGVLLGYWAQLLVLVATIFIATGILFGSLSGSLGELSAPLKNLGLAILVIDFIILVIQHFFLTKIHRINDRKSIRQYWHLLGTISALVLLVVLLMLYNFMLTNGWGIWSIVVHGIYQIPNLFR